jgi:ribosomal RNA-processing protein 9
MGHFDEIMCIAVSPDGKYVATGGKDRRIVIWSNDLLPIKVFETKDKKGIVTGLAFRRGTNELYASCQDLKVRTYNLDSMAQVEILFGHQDMVQDISALGQDRCLTVGSRDRTAIIWKINEETRLTFRGAAKKNQSVVEGSIDCCSMIEDQLFVTGSDNGSISLWSLQKKKPLHVLPLAHGFDKPLAPNEASAEQDLSKIVIPHALPRQITCIYAIPYSNIFFSGSNNSGDIKVWKLSTDHKKFELLSSIEGVNGIVNRISVMEQPKNKSYIVAAVSKEMRLGRWLKLKHAKNGIFVKEISINSSY